MARFSIIGHRGARGLFPENTLEGFRAAFAVGVTEFETDIAISADGIPLLYHDLRLNPELTRGPDGAWIEAPGPAINALKYAELARFDVGRIRPGSAYSARYPEQQACDGAHIPTFASVLQALPEARFTVELKTDPSHPELTVSGPEMAERAVRAAAAAGALGRIRVQSFDWRGPRHLGRVRPEIPRAWLTEPKTVENAALWWGVEPAGRSVAQAVADEGGDVWAPEHSSVTEAAIREARALNLAVVPWTVNAPEAMARFLRWGAAGVITDRPDLAPAL